MQRFAFRKRGPPAGSRPGVLALPECPSPRRIHLIDYSPERVDERDVADVEVLAPYRTSASVSWIEVEGLGDEAGLRRLGELFGIHPLALADVVNAPQRPKTETYENHDLVICHMARLGEDDDTCQVEQVSFVVGKTFVLSFQEGHEDVFDPVRTRIREGALVRAQGSDYLAYALIDTLIDGYYPVLEAIGEELEQLEDAAVSRPVPATMAQIHAARRLILTLGRTMRQQRDAVNALVRGESPRIGPEVRVYFRDAYDHAVQISDVLETYRELAISLMEVYLSSVSNRMNEVMKVLTIISTIFIPLTFIVGVYGMNFEHMPELSKRWAYPALWVLMISIGVAMWFYFRRKGWVGAGAAQDAEPEA
ncbi:MAG TPA: magnesium/cobalt transporter CorA [Myxococcota bacterium]|nr:magnesium/cobalt transporter CorA [Myxococcota bacterium]